MVLRLASGKQVRRSSWKWNIITNKRKHEAFFCASRISFHSVKCFFDDKCRSLRIRYLRVLSIEKVGSLIWTSTSFIAKRYTLFHSEYIIFPEANFYFDIDEWIIPNCKVFGPKYYRMHILKTFSSIVLTPKLLYMLSKFHFISAFGANIGGKSFHKKVSTFKILGVCRRLFASKQWKKNFSKDLFFETV